MSSIRSVASTSSGIKSPPSSSSSRSRTVPATPSSPSSAADANASPSPIPTASAITGSQTTPDAKLFVEAFLPLALKTDQARALRKIEWKTQLDTSGTGRVSPGTVEGWIHRTLRNAVKKQRASGLPRGGTGAAAATPTSTSSAAAALFKKYKPSYIHAYNASIAASSSEAYDDDATVWTVGSITSTTVGSVTTSSSPSARASTASRRKLFVSRREFRLLASNLCFHALAHDAFAAIDADGTHRLTRAEFRRRVGRVRSRGFEALALVGDGDAGGYWDADAVFDRMDADCGGMVLFGEWAAFLRAGELERALSAEAGGRGQPQPLPPQQHPGGGEEAGATSDSATPTAGSAGFWGELLATPSDRAVAWSDLLTPSGATGCDGSHPGSAADWSDGATSAQSGFSLSSTPSSSVAGSIGSPQRSSRIPRYQARSTPPVPSAAAGSSSWRSPRIDAAQSVVDASSAALTEEIESLRRQLRSARDELNAERAARWTEAEGLRAERDEARRSDEARSAENDALRRELDEARGALREDRNARILQEEENSKILEQREKNGDEIDYLRQELESAREELSRQEFRCDEQRAGRDSEAERLNRSISAKEEENEVLLRNIEEVRSELEACQSERDGWKAKLNDEVAARRVEVERLKAELGESMRSNMILSSKEEENEALLQDIEEVRSELEECRRERDIWKAKLSDEAAARQAEVERLKAELDESMRSNIILSSKEEENEILLRNVEEVRSELEECRSERDGWKAKLNDEMAARRAEVERLKMELDESRRRNTNTSTLAKEEENEALLRDLEEARSELEACRSERDCWKAKLNDEAAARRAEVERLKTELDVSRQSGKKTRSAESDALRKELNEAREALNSNNNNNNSNKSRSLEFGDNDGSSPKQNRGGNDRKFFAYILGLLLAAACGFFLCSRTLGSAAADNDRNSDMVGGRAIERPEQTDTAAAEAADSCPDADDFAATVATLEGALRRREAECEAKSRECEADAARLESSYRSCLDEVGDRRDAVDESRRELAALSDARDGAGPSLAAARLSLDECRGSLEAEEASASAFRAEYDRLASRCDKEAADWKMEVRTIGEAKRAAESLLELCDRSSHAKDAAMNAMQARYDRLLEDYNLLERDSKGSEEQRVEDSRTGDTGDIHRRYDELSSAPHERLSVYKKDENSLDGEPKGNYTDELDWIFISGAF